MERARSRSIINQIVEKELFSIRFFKIILEKDRVLYFYDKEPFEILLRTIVEDFIEKLFHASLEQFLKDLNEIISLKLELDNYDLEMIAKVICDDYGIINPDLKKALLKLLPEYIKYLAYEIELKHDSLEIHKKDIFQYFVSYDNIINLVLKSIDSDAFKYDITDIDFKITERSTNPLDNKYYKKANDYFNERKYESALEELDKAIQLDPNHESSYLFKSALLWNIFKKYDEAINELEEVIKIYPKRGYLYSKKAYLLTKLENYDEALITINRAIKIEPDIDLYYDKAKILYKMGRLEESLEFIQKSIEIDYNWHAPLYLKAKIYQKMKKYNKALNSIDKAIDLEPELYFLYKTKAKIQYSLKNYDDAFKSVDYAISKDPKKSDYYETKVHFLYNLEKYEEAIPIIEDAIEKDSTRSRNYIFKYLTLRKLKRLEEALPVLEKIIHYNKDKRNFHWNALKAEHLYNMKRFDEALNLAKELLDNKEFVKSDNKYKEILPVLYKIEALIYTEMSEFQKALEKVEIAINSSPSEKVVDYELFRLKAEILADLKDFDSALETIDIAIEADPEKGINYYTKGALLLRSGAIKSSFEESFKEVFVEAMKEFRKAHNYGFKVPEVLRLVIDGKYDEATKWLNRDMNRYVKLIDIPGISSKTEKKLNNVGIFTLTDLFECDSKLIALKIPWMGVNSIENLKKAGERKLKQTRNKDGIIPLYFSNNFKKTKKKN